MSTLEAPVVTRPGIDESSVIGASTCLLELGESGLGKRGQLFPNLSAISCEKQQNNVNVSMVCAKTSEARPRYLVVVVGA